MAYDGLKGIESELHAKIANQEATGTKIRDAMRAYARDGYKLVFGHGYEYNEPGVEVAKDFPGTVFVSSSGGKTAPNAGAFRFYLEQGFYLAGYMAGKMTKSGVVAMIGGDDVPSIRSTFKGFKAGAEAARPGIRVIEVFTGNGQDVAAAKNATLKAIEQGADFVIHQANAAAQGVFNACKEKGVHAFGANEDQNANSSGVVIASAVITARPAFIALAKQVQEGKYKGTVSLMGMADKAIDFVVNPAMQSMVPKDVMDDVQKQAEAIRSGSLTVPKDEF
jgi:basic membrane lipoprotein Med (substrate-binding protein (PBP1-ABC) superfamily)